MKFTKIPSDAFEHLTLNAGIVLKGTNGFNPTTSSYTATDILGATTGGCTFSATNEYKDFGEDIDSCPKNTLQLKKITSTEATLAGTFVTIDAATCAMLVGAADNTTGHIVPRKDLKTSDFNDLWFVCDYSEYNGATNGGYVAIHLMNCLNTAGFQLVSADDEKGKIAFTFTAHYSMENQDTVPFEIYIKAGTAEG